MHAIGRNRSSATKAVKIYVTEPQPGFFPYSLIASFTVFFSSVLCLILSNTLLCLYPDFNVPADKTPGPKPYSIINSYIKYYKKKHCMYFATEIV